MALGPELITNGTFDTDLSSWIVGAHPDYWVWDAGSAESTAFNAKLSQDFADFQAAIFAGEKCQASFDYTTSGDYSFYFTFGNQAPILISGTGVVTSTFTTQLTITQDDIDLGQLLINDQSSAPGLLVDNVSLRSTTSNLYIQTVQMVGAETGDVQTLNAGKSDNETPINYELETQDLEFGNRSHLKKLSDKIIVFTKNAVGSTLSQKMDNGNYQSIPVSLADRVNIEQNFNAEGHFMNVKWAGVSSTTSPILEGFHITDIFDEGMTNK